MARQLSSDSEDSSTTELCDDPDRCYSSDLDSCMSQEEPDFLADNQCAGVRNSAFNEEELPTSSSNNSDHNSASPSNSSPSENNQTKAEQEEDQEPEKTVFDRGKLKRSLLIKQQSFEIHSSDEEDLTPESYKSANSGEAQKIPEGDEENVVPNNRVNGIEALRDKLCKELPLLRVNSSDVYGTGDKGFRHYLDEVIDDTALSTFSNSLENDSDSSFETCSNHKALDVPSPKTPEVTSSRNSAESIRSTNSKSPVYTFEVATESTVDVARKSDEYPNETSSPFNNFQYSPSDTLYSPQSGSKVLKSSAENHSSLLDQASFIGANSLQHQKPDTKHITLDININTVEAIGPIISPFYPISTPSHDISNDDATLFREQVMNNTSRTNEDKIRDRKVTNRYEKFEEILANNAPANKELSWKYREKWVSEMDISTMHLTKSHNIGKAEASSLSINGLNHSPRNSAFGRYVKPQDHSSSHDKLNHATLSVFAKQNYDSDENFENLFKQGDKCKSLTEFNTYLTTVTRQQNDILHGKSLSEIRVTPDLLKRTSAGTENSAVESEIDSSPFSSKDNRKTYCIKPKINIAEDSDSILKSVVFNNNKNNNSNGDVNGGKLGVWTKVRPRKNRCSSTDRARKIIQENSATLQRILTCQAKKRLPDLEELREEITISPINEEISKIFSPILERMGLDEHEIKGLTKEELTKIKDSDRNTAMTTVSEFDAKINEELSKLSLVDDSDDYTSGLYSPDYLMEDREELLDRQINRELSKLLTNYEEALDVAPVVPRYQYNLSGGAYVAPQKSPHRLMPRVPDLLRSSRLNSSSLENLKQSPFPPLYSCSTNNLDLCGAYEPKSPMLGYGHHQHHYNYHNHRRRSGFSPETPEQPQVRSYSNYDPVDLDYKRKSYPMDPIYFSKPISSILSSGSDRFSYGSTYRNSYSSYVAPASPKLLPSTGSPRSQFKKLSPHSDLKHYSHQTSGYPRFHLSTESLSNGNGLQLQPQSAQDVGGWSNILPQRSLRNKLSPVQSPSATAYNHRQQLGYGMRTQPIINTTTDLGLKLKPFLPTNCD